MSERMNAPKEFTYQQRINWLRLARTPRIGPVTFAQLIGRFKTASAALDALPSFSRSRKNVLTPPSVDLVEQELAQAEAYGARIICATERDYPPLLKALNPPPPVITTLGNIQLAHRPCVAIVGARDASAAGRKLARDISAALGKEDYVIVSGLARGIDGEVHAACLETGTIAVLGGGVDHIYPPQHDRLYAAVAEKGLIVSESFFGYRAQARDFPRRNRIITGLSRGLVVIEAAERSGSLISARTAGEQGREVMAIPGSPLDPRAAGTNRLLRDGAILVRNADDVIECLSALQFGSLNAPPPPLFEYEDESEYDIPQTQIESVDCALSPHPMPIDELARSANISAARCAAILMELELDGKAITLPGGLASKAY